MIYGEGKNPTKDNIMAVANKVGLNKRRAKEIMNEVETTVETANLLNLNEILP